MSQAARRPRPFFEPTDVELEGPGAVELDVQLGYVRGSEAGRVVVPDFEVDVGLLPHLSPSERLDLSVVGAAGVSGTVDRDGVLLGLSPKLRLWH